MSGLAIELSLGTSDFSVRCTTHCARWPGCIKRENPFHQTDLPIWGTFKERKTCPKAKEIRTFLFTACAVATRCTNRFVQHVTASTMSATETLSEKYLQRQRPKLKLKR